MAGKAATAGEVKGPVGLVVGARAEVAVPTVAVAAAAAAAEIPVVAEALVAVTTHVGRSLRNRCRKHNRHTLSPDLHLYRYRARTRELRILA